jgi:ketosteroid isomerase-like protein
MSEANKELVRRHFEEIFNGKDLAAADELMAEDYRLAEHWATREDLVAMLQLGVVQPPGPQPS